MSISTMWKITPVTHLYRIYVKLVKSLEMGLSTLGVHLKNQNIFNNIN